MERTLIRKGLFCCLLATVVCCCTGSGLCVPEHAGRAICIFLDNSTFFCNSSDQCGVQPGQCNQLQTSEKLLCTVYFEQDVKLSKRMCCSEEIIKYKCLPDKRISCGSDKNKCTDLDSGTKLCDVIYLRNPEAPMSTTHTEVHSDNADSSTENTNAAADSNSRVKSLVGVFVTLGLLAITAIAVTLIRKYRR